MNKQYLQQQQQQQNEAKEVPGKGAIDSSVRKWFLFVCLLFVCLFTSEQHLRSQRDGGRL